HFRGLVARGEGVGQHHRVLDVDVVRDHHRPDVGERHAHVLGLATVIAARSVGIAVEAAHRAGLRVGVLPVAIQLLLAIEAAAAEDVERPQDPTTDLEVLHRGAELLHHPDEYMADDLPNPGVRHQTVVDVDVGTADAGPGDADDRVVGMLDFRFGDVLDAHPARATVGRGQHGVLRWGGWRRGADGAAAAQDPDLGG